MEKYLADEIRPKKRPDKDVEKQKKRERSPEIDVGRHSGKQEKPNHTNPKKMY